MDKQPSLSGLWRIGPVAKKLGVSVEVFRKACESGVIPVTVVSLGPRSTYIKVSEFEAWYQPSTRFFSDTPRPSAAAGEDLFS